MSGRGMVSYVCEACREAGCDRCVDVTRYRAGLGGRGLLCSCRRNGHEEWIGVVR